LLADKDHTAVVLLIGDYYIFIFLSRLDRILFIDARVNSISFILWARYYFPPFSSSVCVYLTTAPKCRRAMRGEDGGIAFYPLSQKEN
jgi:hypothetical protein